MAAGLISAVTLVAYCNSFRSPLIFDDFRCILENPSIRELFPLGPVLSPPATSMVGSRPLANLSFAFNWALGGPSVTGYHILNFAFHVGAALALFGIVRRTLARQPSIASPRGAPVDALVLAWFVAALWATHPLLTAAVSYIAQRTEVLMGLCYLFTLYAFIRGTERTHRGWLITSVMACALGMMSKEVMVTAPLAVLLYDRTYVSRTFREALRQRGFYYLALAATWLVLAAVMHGGLDPLVGLNRGVSSWSYALVQCRALATYAFRSVWPHPLVFDYGEAFPTTVAAALPFLWAPVALVSGVVYCCVRRAPAVLTVAWIALTLASTSSVVPITLQPIAENRTYLPLAGMLVLGVLGLYAMIGRRGLVVAALVGVANVALTIHRNEIFHDPVAPWVDTVQKRPDNSRAHSNLAFALHVTGRLAEAEAHYQEALRLKPTLAEAQNSYGSLLFVLGRIPEAIAHGAEAVRLSPQFVIARSNLATALLSAGRYDEGIAQLETALKLDPSMTRLHHNLALALTYSGRPREALDHFAAVFRVEAGTPTLHFQYGNALYATGNRAAAFEQYRASLAQQPDQPDVLFKMGALLFEEGRFAESVQASQAAVRLKPDHVDAHYNLGVALTKLGRNAEATTAFETALKLKPDYELARQALANPALKK